MFKSLKKIVQKLQRQWWPITTSHAQTAKLKAVPSDARARRQPVIRRRRRRRWRFRVAHSRESLFHFTLAGAESHSAAQRGRRQRQRLSKQSTAHSHDLQPKELRPPRPTPLQVHCFLSPLLPRVQVFHTRRALLHLQATHPITPPSQYSCCCLFLCKLRELLRIAGNDNNVSPKSKYSNRFFLLSLVRLPPTLEISIIMT